MAAERSKLLRMRIENLGCIGPEGLAVSLDRVLCLVGQNNTGKTTVLRAYELAVTSAALGEGDYCTRAAGTPAAVEIWLRIPKGTPNIGEKWISAGEELGARWTWSGAGAKPQRRTWNVELKDWDPDEKAAGLDAVFAARLPRPFRVGALESPEAEHDMLLKLVLEPIEDRLKGKYGEEGSPLRTALDQYKAAVDGMVSEAKADIEKVKTSVNAAYRRVFPDLAVEFHVAPADLSRPKDGFLKGSHLRVVEAASVAAAAGEDAPAAGLSWTRQGTGAQRALFWSLVEARSAIAAAVPVAGAGKVGKGKVSKPKSQASDTEGTGSDTVAAAPPGEGNPAAADDSRGPGYMLLIDEPETSLHPNAIRAARKALYDLARADGSMWQVMLSTHSPMFIDPTDDHTTIVRLERAANGHTPRTFRAEEPRFDGDERRRLKALLQFDTNLAEMFFGGFPVLVEGDTEYAAFHAAMQQHPQRFPRPDLRPLLIRARGKEILPLLVRLVAHFRVPFAVLHDVDSPLRADGKANSAWSANKRIHEEIEAARVRDPALRVVHRVALPDFERQFGQPERSSEKPWEMWCAVLEGSEVAEKVAGLLEELISPAAVPTPFDGDFMTQLTSRVAGAQAQPQPAPVAPPVEASGA